MRRRTGILLLSAVLLAAFAGPLAAAELNVSAAASLTDALQEIKSRYEAQSDDKILLNLGASSTLARQIEQGAPADLFLSADEAKMDALEKKGLLLPGTRRSVLSNTLVVVVPADSPLKIGSAADLAGPKVRVLALAEPQTVPAGILPGHQKIVGTRMPPSKVAPLAPRRGPADPACSSKSDQGPLSLVKMTRVWPSRFRARSVSTTRPTLASISSTTSP
jgi:hypothetical protein